MWTLPAILSVGALSYALCDVRSGNLLTRAICPMIFTLSLAALAVWIYIKASASDWRGRDDGSSNASDTTGPPSGNDDAD
jgi:hypothetical protein